VINHVNSQVLFAPSVKNIGMSWIEPPHIVCDLARYALNPLIVWESSMSEFVLKRLIELVENEDSCSYRFRES
jgi:hypothetical protein